MQRRETHNQGAVVIPHDSDNSQEHNRKFVKFKVVSMKRVTLWLTLVQLTTIN